MNLTDIINRNIPPLPWVEGEKIPWDEAEFSQRMLQEHLSQAHNAASRRTELIEQHINWLHTEILAGEATRILDLGCGPGLYTNRLAQLGHQCVGIDYGPVSISYAKQQADEQGLLGQYSLADIREAPFGTGYGLVMMIHGELNVFRPAAAKRILSKSFQALKPGGKLVLEVHPLAVVREIGERGSRWYSSSSGLFSAVPHLYLQEAYWDEAQQVTTERYYILEAQDQTVKRYAASMQGYSDSDYSKLLSECGYQVVAVHPSLCGETAEKDGNYLVLVAQKPKTR